MKKQQSQTRHTNPLMKTLVDDYDNKVIEYAIKSSAPRHTLHVRKVLHDGTWYVFAEINNEVVNTFPVYKADNEAEAQDLLVEIVNKVKSDPRAIKIKYVH